MSGLEADGWTSVTRILCSKAGPTCGCGSYAYRSRRLDKRHQSAGRNLVDFRCEACGKTRTLDILDPGATVDRSSGTPAVVVQDSLF